MLNRKAINLHRFVIVVSQSSSTRMDKPFFLRYLLDINKISFSWEQQVALNVWDNRAITWPIWNDVMFFFLKRHSLNEKWIIKLANYGNEHENPYIVNCHIRQVLNAEVADRIWKFHLKVSNVFICKWWGSKGNPLLEFACEFCGTVWFNCSYKSGKIDLNLLEFVVQILVSRYIPRWG